MKKLSVGLVPAKQAVIKCREVTRGVIPTFQAVREWKNIIGCPVLPCCAGNMN